MKTATIKDGMYFLHADGSCWTGAKYRNGKCVGTVEEANAGTHAAANDRWAGVVPDDTDVEVSGDEALAVIRDLMGEDVSPECVVVTRLPGTTSRVSRQVPRR